MREEFKKALQKVYDSTYMPNRPIASEIEHNKFKAGAEWAYQWFKSKLTITEEEIEALEWLLTLAEPLKDDGDTRNAPPCKYEIGSRLSTKLKTLTPEK